MQKHTRRQENKLKLKNEILETAAAMIVREGAEALSMRKIAAKIGISATAIYLFFKNKESLLDALAEREEQRFFAQLQTTLAETELPLCEQLKAYGKTFVTFALTEPKLFLCVFYPHQNAILKNKIHIDASALQSHSFQLFLKLIRDGQEQGLFKPIPELDCLQSFWYAAHGFILGTLSNKTYNITEALKQFDTLEDLLLSGLCTAQGRN